MRMFPVIIALLAACTGPPKQPLTIAVASNMQYAIEDITDAFERQFGYQCEVIISSSGKLSAQIREGAPFDLLVAADMKYPQMLYQQGLTRTEPKVYAYGRLVLWSTGVDFTPSFDALLSTRVKHIAMANPQLAPYGQAAMEIMEHYQVMDRVSEKLVYGESISQVNQFVISGAAEAGFTAKSVVLSKAMKDQGEWIEIDHRFHQPIAQGIVILNTENKVPAKHFYDFLLSPEGQQILQKYGYESST